MRGESRAGFTMTEAVVALAIAGILATIAVPNFIRLQLRSKTVEALTNLAVLRDAELARYAEIGAYVWAGSAPAGSPGPQRRPWTGANTLEFRELLGFSPDGDVYFQYGVEASGDMFTLTAQSDLDGHGPLAQFALVHVPPGDRVGLPGAIGTCSPRGVYDPRAGESNRLGVIGPCGPDDGRERL